MKKVENSSDNSLKRQLSPLHVWAIAFGCVIGWGSFINPGKKFLPNSGVAGTAIAMVLEQAEICLVSELEPDFVRQIFLEPYPTAQAAVDHAFEKMGPDATVIVMPWGGSTLPHAE